MNCFYSIIMMLPLVIHSLTTEKENFTSTKPSLVYSLENISNMTHSFEFDKTLIHTKLPTFKSKESTTLSVRNTLSIFNSTDYNHRVNSNSETGINTTTSYLIITSNSTNLSTHNTNTGEKNGSYLVVNNTTSSSHLYFNNSISLKSLGNPFGAAFNFSP